MSAEKKIQEQHPLRRLFRNLTGRAFDQTKLSDRDLLVYLSNLLTEFSDIESVYQLRDDSGKRIEYLIDMFELARAGSLGQRKASYQYIGDYSLFILGMFPESLSYGRRSIPVSYYSDTGRRSYMVASRLEKERDQTIVFRKLADNFEHCVVSLHWVREYATDPFYQFMLREFGVT